jgi:hypothetical protein
VKELLDKQANITGDRPQTTIGDTVTGGVHMAQAHFRKQGELSIECDVQHDLFL